MKRNELNLLVQQLLDLLDNATEKQEDFNEE